MIETERLILRPWREADRDPFHETLGRDPRVMEHFGGPGARADSDATIDRAIALQRDRGHCMWAVERRGDGALLGICGIKLGDPGTPIVGAPEVGWRLRADAWGQGYAQEAAAAGIGWVWRTLPDARVFAITNLANHRSWGLMERLGMIRRRDLDFAHPRYAPDDPQSATITYSIDRPA